MPTRRRHLLLSVVFGQFFGSARRVRSGGAEDVRGQGSDRVRPRLRRPSVLSRVGPRSPLRRGLRSRVRGYGEPVTTGNAALPAMATSRSQLTRRLRAPNRSLTFSHTVASPFTRSWMASSMVPIRAVFASSYPSKSQPSKDRHTTFGSSSRSARIILRRLDFPLPQSPNTPTVVGSSRSDRTILPTADAKYPNRRRSVFASLSDHTVLPVPWRPRNSGAGRPATSEPHAPNHPASRYSLLYTIEVSYF